MKKALNITLLFFFLMYIMGPIMVFSLARLYLRMEAKSIVIRQSGNEIFDTLKIPMSNAGQLLNWENRKEFRFRGKLYDLVEKTICDDTLILVAVNDTREEQLIQVFLEMQKNEHKNPVKDRCSRVLKWIATEWQCNTRSHFVLNEKHITYSHCYLQQFSMVFPDIPGPPPKSI